MDIEQLMRKAEELSRLDENREALEIYHQILARESDHPQALLNRGTLLYSRLNEIQAARNDFDRYIELKPNSPQGYIDRGALFRWVYFEHNDPAQLQLSIDDATKAIEVGEHDFGGRDEEEFIDDTYFQRGSAHWELGEWESAFHDLSRCMERDFVTSNCYAMRARAGYETRRFELALSDLNHAIEDEDGDDDPEYFELRNKILRALGKPIAPNKNEKTAAQGKAEPTRSSKSSKWWWPF